MQQHLRRTARGVCLLGVVAINDLDIKIAAVSQSFLSARMPVLKLADCMTGISSAA